MDRSRRSFIPEKDEVDVAAGFAGAEGAGEVKEEKSPKPLELLMFRCFWTGGLATGGDFGVESKKLPPPPNMDELLDGGDLVEAKLSRPENGDALGCCCGWAG